MKKIYITGQVNCNCRELELELKHSTFTGTADVSLEISLTLPYYFKRTRGLLTGTAGFSPALSEAKPRLECQTTFMAARFL